MMQKHISPAEAREFAESARRGVPVHVVMVTLDSHMASAASRAMDSLSRDLPGVSLAIHAVTDWAANPDGHKAYEKDVADADIVIASMIFMEDHIALVKPALDRRRDACDVMIGCLSAAEIVRLTKIGKFSMSEPAGGAMSFLKKLAGKGKKGTSAGRGQMKMLRALPRLLKYIPGKAQDLRAYFLTLQYLLAGSDENIANLVRFLIGKYAAGEREGLRAFANANEPVEYPDVGLYHPAMPGRRVSEDLAQFRRHVPRLKDAKGTVGLLVMRSYLLADNTAHYDGVIRALNAQGLDVIPAFASGLDGRAPIEAFFLDNRRAVVDCVISLTGFSLVGGPAYNDTVAAEATLAALDVPYLSAYAIEFQSLQEWGRSEQGLTPVETTIMVALPEIDGATGPMLFGGRADQSGPCQGCARRCAFENAKSSANSRDMQSCPERAEMLAARATKLVALRRTPKEARRIATVLYNFPPNGGATGTAAFLSVFQSLFNTLRALKADGYTVDMPDSVDALREAILNGNAAEYGQAANVAFRVPVEEHIRNEPNLMEIEAQWGATPGRAQTNGRDIFVLGACFGNVFVGVQPPFGYEGDPMRLLFEKSFTPTHAFAAFYRHIRDRFAAHAILHFGTHGALEFMPGKQSGLSAKCWPDRLIGATPNFYLYAANNPSEGTIARRRSAATLITYLTPPVVKAGLYKGLLDLKGALERWRAAPSSAIEERTRLAESIFAQAAALDLMAEGAKPGADADAVLAKLVTDVTEYEMALVPHGLHVIGEAETAAARADLLNASNEGRDDAGIPQDMIDAVLRGDAVAGAGLSDDQKATLASLTALNAALSRDNELPAVLRALDARYIAPVSGGDVLRTPEIAPTGRNMHGFDPFRMPSPFAVEDGMMQANRLVERYARDHGRAPQRVAMVLWGTDNLKTEGAQIAQALALIGARPRFDSFGRLAGADLIALSELGRPRIDVVATLSGIFRDLLPLQTRLLADAALKAAEADERAEDNPIRAHARAYAAAHGCSLEDAALRVFSNASGVYGSNVNLLVDSAAWEEEDELANAYQSRKSFAYGRDGKPVKREALLTDVLAVTDTAYQNIESVELGITSVDHYFDTLGGITRAIRKAGGGEVTVYVGDQTTGAGKVRSLNEQVALETRTRMLNPKWYEGLLAHGYEGVRQIESAVTNTLGWSATTGQVSPWVYKQLTETFVTDPAMRERMAALNPKASAKLANRLIEAGDRNFWAPDAETWEALRAAGDELEDRVEGILPEGVR
jgi:magnesium chelatase subunit H